jgi:hypothetical protein
MERGGPLCPLCPWKVSEMGDCAKGEGGLLDCGEDRFAPRLDEGQGACRSAAREVVWSWKPMRNTAWDGQVERVEQATSNSRMANACWTFAASPRHLSVACVGSHGSQTIVDSSDNRSLQSLTLMTSAKPAVHRASFSHRVCIWSPEAYNSTPSTILSGPMYSPNTRH